MLWHSCGLHRRTPRKQMRLTERRTACTLPLPNPGAVSGTRAEFVLIELTPLDRQPTSVPISQR